MGRRKLDYTEFISESERRYVTYSKRKRGLLKKAIELSKMCDQHISITIFDKER